MVASVQIANGKVGAVFSDSFAAVFEQVTIVFAFILAVNVEVYTPEATKTVKTKHDNKSKQNKNTIRGAVQKQKHYSVIP